MVALQAGAQPRFPPLEVIDKALAALQGGHGERKAGHHTFGVDGGRMAKNQVFALSHAAHVVSETAIEGRGRLGNAAHGGVQISGHGGHREG